MADGMNNLPIMSEHEAHLLLRIEVMQQALQTIATNPRGISDRDTIARMRDIATKALKGE